MKLVPLGDKVVVKKSEPKETTEGGIVLPESARERTLEGRVLSVGDGRMMSDGTRVPLQVKEGDRILYSEWAGTEVNVGDEELLILSESDILAILE